MFDSLVKKFKQFHQELKDREDYRLKKEMCQSAVKGGVCPNYCHHCAWNTGVIKND